MRRMTEYGAFCPVSLATEVLAERWTPMVIRELVLGNTRFNDIARGLPGISRSLLTQRLRHLERKGVVETWPSPTGRGNEYHLTPAGKDLYPVIEAMANWVIEWLYDDLDSDDVDADHPHVVDAPADGAGRAAAGAGHRRVPAHRPRAQGPVARARPGGGVGVPAATRGRTPTSS